MHFINERHVMRYFQALKEYGINPRDNERKALMYCLSSMESIYNRMDKVYNKASQGIVLHKTGPGNDMADYTVDPCFGGLEKIIIRLGFNLYNGYIDANVNPRALYMESPSMRRVVYQAMEIFFAGDNYI